VSQWNRSDHSYEYDRRMRTRALTYYGGDPPRCECCGENRVEFLSIDHIEGGGRQHLLSMGGISGARLYRWLYRNDYPAGFRVLCYNCNMSYGLYHRCPHNNQSLSSKLRLSKEERIFVKRFEKDKGAISVIMKDLDGKKYVIDTKGKRHKIVSKKKEDS
jgi:hypothetical protein